MAGNLPYEAISAMILHVLGLRGRTIPEMESTKGIAYEGDAWQKPHKNRPVWYNKADIDRIVASKMKLSSAFYGPERKSNIFPTFTFREIDKFRKKGIIKDWNSKSHRRIFRLADGVAHVQIPVMSAASRPVDNPHAQATQKMGMKQAFVKLLADGNMDGTYKFAFARALLDHCSRPPNDETRMDKIHYDYLAGRFLYYYWHQQCKFHIKQDFHTKSEPVVVQAINKVWDANAPNKYELLERKDIETAKNLILDGVFGHWRDKSSIVVHKFQNMVVDGSKRVEENRVFYDADDDGQVLTLKPNAYEFFYNNNRVLLGLVIVEWAKFLERINERLPRLVAKVEGDEIERDPRILADFKKLYLKHTCDCFYCGTTLRSGRRTHMDHFIPWSYIYSDSGWNLVPACQECNLSKSDMLPPRDYVCDLIRRNKAMADRVGDGGAILKILNSLKDSLDILGAHNDWSAEIRNHYDRCRDYGFGIWAK